MTLFYPIFSLRLTEDITMIFIGIDISKRTFDAAYFINKRYVHKQFSNKTRGLLILNYG